MNIKRYERNTSGKDYVVGDIHGYFGHLQHELDRIGFDPVKDRLFSVGDLVDRGPESNEVMLWLSLPWFHPVAGNHEQMAIDFYNGELPASWYASNGGAWNIANDTSTRAEIAMAFADLPLAIEIVTGSGIVGIVHADCSYDDWCLMRDILNWSSPGGMDFMHVKNHVQWSRNRIVYNITTHVMNVRAVVVGHTPLGRMKTLGNTIFIDTGVHLGRKCTIIDAETLQQVN